MKLLEWRLAQLGYKFHLAADFDKLDKSLEKSFLTKNIGLKNDDKYFASGDFTFWNFS